MCGPQHTYKNDGKKRTGNKNYDLGSKVFSELEQNEELKEKRMESQCKSFHRSMGEVWSKRYETSRKVTTIPKNFEISNDRSLLLEAGEGAVSCRSRLFLQRQIQLD